jgi:hypothetical protein
MKDSDARGLVLKALYDIRHTMYMPAIPADVPGLPDLESQTLYNIVNQLREKGLITFTPLMGGDEVMGRAMITGHGSDVIEGTAQSSITVTVDNSVNVQGSQGVQIGGQGNTQNVSLDVAKLINAIDSGTGTIQEKEEAKSLLRKLADNPLVKGVLDWWLKSHGAG